MNETNYCCFKDCIKEAVVLIDTLWVCAGHCEYHEGLQRVREQEQKEIDDAIAYLDPDWDREGG